MDAIIHIFTGILGALNVDQTVFIQFGVSLVGTLLVAQILIMPLFRYQLKREAMTTGLKDELIKVGAEIERCEKEYTDKMTLAHRRAKGVVDTQVATAQEQARKIMKSAKDRSDESLATIREEIKLEVAVIEKSLTKDMGKIVENIVERVL